MLILMKNLQNILQNFKIKTFFDLKILQQGFIDKIILSLLFFHWYKLGYGFVRTEIK